MGLPGRVVVDETRIYRIFANTDGWVREISPYTPGSIVKKDALLATYASRDSLTPQRAYLYSMQARDQNKTAQSTEGQNVAIEMQIRNAMEGLVAMGVSDTQIRELERTREISPNIQVRAPENGIILARNVALGLRLDRNAELYRMADISRVWVLADVYQQEAKLIPLGAKAQVRCEGHTLAAAISDTLPLFDAATRTLKVRLELDNPGYILRPDMFVDVDIPVKLPAAVTVPVDAVIDSGMRKVVYVDAGRGSFEPREVETGWRFGDRVAITRGLEAGERIVVAGTFLVDSESHMKLAAVGAAARPKAGMEKDPVCGMDVDPAKALKLDHQGKTLHFCSESCRKRFQERKAGADQPHRGAQL